MVWPPRWWYLCSSHPSCICLKFGWTVLTPKHKYQPTRNSVPLWPSNWQFTSLLKWLENPAFLHLCVQYQSIVGSIKWFMTNTVLIAPIASFLGAYNHAPTQQHMDATLHAVKHICSTSEYGIAFHFNTNTTATTFMYFSFYYDIEAHCELAG